MKLFILTVFCNLLSSGYLQQTINVDSYYNSIQPDAGKNDWPEQTFHTNQGNLYGQEQRTIPEKPCSRRSPSDNEPISQRISQEISPPPVSKVETLTSAPLKPQALRHEEFTHKITPKHVPVSNPQHTIDNKLLKTRNSLIITNPVIDSTEELVPPVNNEIQEDNPKTSEQMRSTPTSDSLSSSTSGDKSADSRRDQPKPISGLRIPSDNEYGTQPENHYNSEPSKLIASESKGLRSAKIKMPSTDKNEYPGFAANFDSTETQTLPPSLIAKLLLTPEAMDLLHSNKCSHDKEPDNLIGHSRRSMSSYNDENNAKDVLSNDKDYLRNNNDPYIESHIENENAMASVLNAEKNTVKTHKGQPLNSLDKSKSPTLEKSVPRARPPFNEARREMIEPTKGAGLMGQSALMLMQSERICYACSTANNPSCWAPDRKTTVKYCRKGNNACITKTFGEGAAFTLIRDCGKSCDDSDTAGIMPKYKSCSMCHSELCNGAYSVNGQSIIFALVLIGLVKYFN